MPTARNKMDKGRRVSHFPTRAVVAIKGQERKEQGLAIVVTLVQHRGPYDVVNQSPQALARMEGLCVSVERLLADSP